MWNTLEEKTYFDLVWCSLVLQHEDQSELNCREQYLQHYASLWGAGSYQNKEIIGSVLNNARFYAYDGLSY